MTALAHLLISYDMQEFLKVFGELRDELVNDGLLERQPESSKQWVKEVSSSPAFAGTRNAF
jgi:hypothetical protein